MNSFSKFFSLNHRPFFIKILTIIYSFHLNKYITLLIRSNFLFKIFVEAKKKQFFLHKNPF